MDLQKELLSSNNPTEVLFEQGGSFYELIEKLHQSESLPDQIMIPIIEIGQICGFNFLKITQPLLKTLVSTLEQYIDQSPEKIHEILDVLLPYLNCPPFYSLFEKIVLNMPSLPDDFLLSLTELSSEQLLAIFPTQQSKAIIFLKCKPIFHRLLFKTINDFVDDPLNIDQFLNSIRIVVPKKPVIEDFSQEFNFYINLQNARSRTSSLKDLHNDICENAKNSLLNLCCESFDLYQEICCILRDLWEKTGNSLFAALRIEISYENLPWRQDPIFQFSRWIFNFLSNYSIINTNPSPPIDTKDALFAMNDPLFQFLLHCVFLKSLVTRISKNNYIPFNKRDDSRNLVQILYPQVSPTQIEDFANYIEAYYVAIAIYDDTSSDESNSLKLYISDLIEKEDKFCNMILFCGQQMILRRKDQSFLDIVFDLIQKRSGSEIETDNNYFMNSPNLIVAHMMMSHLSYYGLVEKGTTKGDSIDKRMNILFKWSKINHSIRKYFISLLVKRSNEVLKMAISVKNDRSRQVDNDEPPFYMNEYEIVNKWMNKVLDEFEDLELIDNAMLETTNNNLETVLM